MKLSARWSSLIKDIRGPRSIFHRLVRPAEISRLPTEEMVLFLDNTVLFEHGN
jgi:hypothetical protein